jgi:hypothetical protein
MIVEYFHRSPLLVKLTVMLVALLFAAIPLKNTIALAERYFDLKSSVNLYMRSTGRTQNVKANAKLLDAFDHEKKIFEGISKASQAYKVIIKQVDLPKIIENGGVVIQSQEIQLQGDYIDILKTLRDVNEDLEPIKISNARFERVEDNKKVNLVAHIFFQSVKLADAHEE